MASSQMIAFQFERPPRTANDFGVHFLKQLALNNIALKKKSENFNILQSHNQLSARCLQKTNEPSIYKNAKIGKEGSSKSKWLNPYFCPICARITGCHSGGLDETMGDPFDG